MTKEEELEDYLPFWGSLTAGQRTALEDSATWRHAPAGTVLHNGSSDCVGLFLVSSGQLRAYILSEEGKEVTVFRLLEGDLCLLSASCMIRSVQFDVTVSVEKDADLWVIPTGVYQQLMEESAEVANFTNQVMASRFSDVMWLVEQVLWKSFDCRLATFLLEESVLDGSDSLHITHERIAQHLGSAREVVTRMLRYFQEEGLVELARGTVRIIDRERLRALASRACASR